MEALTYKSAIRFVAVSSCAFVLGCGELIGADGYAVADSSSGGEASLPRAAPLDPMPAYLTGSACESCVANGCAEAQRACEQDRFCSETVADLREHPDPLSAQGRYQRLTEALWKDAIGEEDESLLWQDFAECTVTHCLSQCEIGRDFSCVGNFDWDIEFPSFLRTGAFNFATGLPTPAPWRVTACSASDVECRNPLGSATTDANGLAVIEFESVGAPYSEFGGFLSWDGGPAYNDWVTIVSRPFATGDFIPWGFPSRADILTWFERYGGPFREDAGYIWVAPTDCRGLPAKGVQLDVQIAGADGLEPCEECVYTYEDGRGTPDVRFADFGTAGRIGFVSYVPPRQVALVLKPTDGSTFLAIQSISVLPGRIYFVLLTPASEGQLGDAPPG